MKRRIKLSKAEGIMVAKRAVAVTARIATLSNRESVAIKEIVWEAELVLSEDRRRMMALGSIKRCVQFWEPFKNRVGFALDKSEQYIDLVAFRKAQLQEEDPEPAIEERKEEDLFSRRQDPDPITRPDLKRIGEGLTAIMQSFNSLLNRIESFDDRLNRIENASANSRDQKIAIGIAGISAEDFKDATNAFRGRTLTRYGARGLQKMRVLFRYFPGGKIREEDFACIDYVICGDATSALFYAALRKEIPDDRILMGASSAEDVKSLICQLFNDDFREGLRVESARKAA